MNRDITFTEVYRINGRLVVANSLEGAIVTWRERMAGTGDEITKIEKMENTSPTTPPALENRAMMFTDICGEDGMHRQSQEKIACLEAKNRRLKEEIEQLKQSGLRQVAEVAVDAVATLSLHGYWRDKLWARLDDYDIGNEADVNTAFVNAMLLHECQLPMAPCGASWGSVANYKEAEEYLAKYKALWDDYDKWRQEQR